MKWNKRHGAVATAFDQRWDRNKGAVRFTPSALVGASSKRVLRRELVAFLGRPLSGRQWKRWAKQQRREEHAVRVGAAIAVDGSAA